MPCSTPVVAGGEDAKKPGRVTRGSDAEAQRGDRADAKKASSGVSLLHGLWRWP